PRITPIGRPATGRPRQLSDPRHIAAQPAPLGVGSSQGDPRSAQEETSMTKFKTIITAAIAALALTTASLAIPGQAFAGGHGHGGHGGHGHHGIGGGHFGHGFFGGHTTQLHHFFAYNSCWKWSPYGPVNVCYRYY